MSKGSTYMYQTISNAYEKFDDLIMSGVNNAVRAWNWTTGRTKNDLAKLFFMGGSLSIIYGSLVSENAAGKILGPFCALPGLYGHLTASKIEDLESDYSDSKAISYDIEIYKMGSSFEGPLFSAMSPIFLSSYLTGHDNLDALYIGTGFASMGLGNYILRADPLPPGKNVFSRAKDYLSGKFGSLEEVFVS